MVNLSERGLVSVKRGHRSPVPRLDLSSRGMGGSSMYHGEQVPLSGRTVRGREDHSQQSASPSEGVEVDNGPSPQQAGEQSEHPMDEDNTSGAARRELQFMSPIGGNEMLPSHQGEKDEWTTSD